MAQYQPHEPEQLDMQQPPTQQQPQQDMSVILVTAGCTCSSSSHRCVLVVLSVIRVAFFLFSSSRNAATQTIIPSVSGKHGVGSAEGLSTSSLIG
jgi:hypothetical protein